MTIKKFKIEEIPFEKLEIVGLNRQMVDDFPPEALSLILAGQLSPVVPMTVTGPTGEQHSAYARFHLNEGHDGQIDVRIHPVLPPLGETMLVSALDPETGKVGLKEIKTSERYSEKVIERLKAGKAVWDMMYRPDGSKEAAVLQLDPETNEILSEVSFSVSKNLQKLEKDFDLTNSEANCLFEGDRLSIVHGDSELITMGIDLLMPTGVRIIKGDEKAWVDSRKRDWDKYELGVNGCWMTDDDGNLLYVEEEDFSKYDIWNEVEKQNNRKAQHARAGMTL